jgi:hypothetical protein
MSFDVERQQAGCFPGFGGYLALGTQDSFLFTSEYNFSFGESLVQSSGFLDAREGNPSVQALSYRMLPKGLVEFLLGETFAELGVGSADKTGLPPAQVQQDGWKVCRGEIGKLDCPHVLGLTA